MKTTALLRIIWLVFCFPLAVPAQQEPVPVRAVTIETGHSVLAEGDYRGAFRIYSGTLWIIPYGSLQLYRERGQTQQYDEQVVYVEKIVQGLAACVAKLDSPPAVPEDAEFHALKGAAFVKQAGDAAAFAKAAAEFRAAITTAPWVGEYHYNLAVCEKSAGQFGAARTAAKFAQILARDAKERRECLALRAELEAAQDLAAAKQAEAQKAAAARAAKAAADTPQAREAALMEMVEGARFVVRAGGPGGLDWENIYEIKNRELYYTIRLLSLGTQKAFYGHSKPGDYLVERMPYRDGVFTFTEPYTKMVTIFRIGPDGRTLTAERGDGVAAIPRK